MQYTLKQWVNDQGGALRAGQKLGVTDQAVWKWLRGDGAGRVLTLLKIVKLSKGRVKLHQIIEYSTRNKKRR